MKATISSYHLRHPSSLTALLLVVFLLLAAPSPTTANDFEPYTLNGGLVSAVAGRDFVVVASDTRLTNGYEILSRNHLSSRLWVASSGSTDHPPSPLVSGDGSVLVPPPTDERPAVPPPPFPIRRPPTFVASAGCASDCEALKRQIRSEIGSHVDWNCGGRTMSPTGVANLLGQTLYARRGFPFYSFCIAAGLGDAGGGAGGGVVHVYDAIGSHERVAVACAGTGKEMLQPVLDRSFASSASGSARGSGGPGGGAQEGVGGGGGSSAEPIGENGPRSELVRDGRAVRASEQRIGLRLRPPVETCVTCGAEEAMALLVRGYRSVAEREIAVGDSVVLCLIRNGGGKDSPCTMEVFHHPLKKH